jgi:hypothetical protein
MTRFLAITLSAFLLPLSAFAATVTANQDVTISEAAPGNVYLAGMNVRITAPVVGDAAALGATTLIIAPIRGDALLTGGTIDADGPVEGDLRAIGARVSVEGNATGDIFAIGGSVRVKGKGADLRLGGITVAALDGANGPTQIYGVNVTLGGDFAGDVRAYASDHITVLPGTHIKGVLEYDAPQQADLPEDAVVDGGVVYTGNSSFLPTSKQAETFAIAGAGLFLIVRIIAFIVVAGLVAGLFPGFTNMVAERSLGRSFRRSLLLALLGLAMAVVTPLLVFLLALSFVGAGLAVVVAVGYILLLLVSYAYAGVLAGGAIARFGLKKTGVSWRAALLGALVLSLVGLIPVIGGVIVAVLTALAGGAIVSTCYRFAFGRDTSDI